ncbi:54S ribosomal protein L17 mitochondrial [Thoreauomyces humboldtii]|nr:54S ribosomal protein L17 mitochondrial [Thoreauomyces humboldtii]
MPSRTILKRCLATAASASPTSSRSTAHVGILLKRDPVVLRDLTPFEHAYYAYRDSLEQGEARPFNPDFYFKKGSSAEQRWTAAQQAAVPQRGEVKPRLVQPRDEEISNLAAASRVTEADAKKDMKSLNRALHRTLYLVTRKASGPAKGKWELPSGRVEGDEVLREAADRSLRKEVGGELETWVVGNTPVGHLFADGQKVFYMKAHILSGKITPDGKIADDYAWATKEELKEYLAPEQYFTLSRMLAAL